MRDDEGLSYSVFDINLGAYHWVALYLRRCLALVGDMKDVCKE